MENNKTNQNEATETKKKHGRTMRHVAYTFTHKNAEVKALLKEHDPSIPDNANRGKWISSLMEYLRKNAEFRIAFAELIIAKKSLTEKIKKGLSGKVETVQERTQRVVHQQKGNKNFCCFEGQQLPADPELLAEELFAAANSSSEMELEGLVKNSQQVKATTNILFIGGVILAGWFVYNRWIK